jgi:uncharacterized protein (DUF3084 family)
MTLAILILGLVVATSFIAYWADNLGKKLGKKRISLLGIRPKQTATLISIISSVAIMLLTVGVLLLAFPGLRDALLRYDSAKQAAVELGKKNTELSHSINGLKAQRQTLDKQLTSLQNASAKAKLQRKTAVAQLAKVRASLNDLRRQLTRTIAAEKIAKQGEKTAKAKAISAGQRYEQVAQKLKDAQQKVASSQKLLAQSLNQLKSTNQSLAKTNNDFKAARQQLAKANSQLQQTQKSLASVQRNFELVDQQVKTTLDQYRDAARNVEKLKQTADDLKTELNFRQQQLASLEFVAYQVATGNVEVTYGTVFAQTLVPSKTDPALVKAQLQALLESGQKAVQGKYTIALAPQPIAPGQPATSDSAKIIDYVARILSDSDVAASARLIAARDHAVGENEIQTRFILVPIRTIFQKDEVIAASQINASDGDAIIFHQLLDLVNQGETKAHEKGSMPITTQDSPFYAAGTPERVFEALRQIQTHTGTVNVKMIAAQNITTIDSMQVQFVVANGNPSS